MEQLDIIFLPFAILAAIVLGFAVWAVIKFRKLYENKSEVPGILDDFDLSQRRNDVLHSQ